MKQIIRFVAWVALFTGAFSTVAAPLTNYGSCAVVPAKKQICVDTTPCKTLTSGYTACLSGVTLPKNAVRVPASCWSYQTVYSCEDSSSVDTCSSAPWMQKYGASCVQTDMGCATTSPDTGKCESWRYTYACETVAAQKEKVMECTSSALGVDLSMPTPKVTPNNPAKATAVLEAAREISAYSTCDIEKAIANPDDCLNKRMFDGVYETCSKGYWGLKNCCKGIPGAQSNSATAQMAFAAGGAVVKYAGAQVVDAASPYVFDALYSSGAYATGMLNEMAANQIANAGTTFVVNEGAITATNFASSGLSISAYGFTYGTGVVGTTLPGTMVISQGSWGYLTFNPYVFVIMVVIMIVMQLIECKQSEQVLGMHKGQNLSVQVSEECTSKMLGSCVEWEEGWCSYNGVIGKVMATQGRQQLGLGLDKNCEGISLKQMQQIDWSKLDLSELEAQVASQATKNTPNSSTVTTTYQNALNASPVNGANTQSTEGLAYPPTYTTP